MNNYIGRISEQHHELYCVILENETPHREIHARVSGKLSYKWKNPEDYPAVGDLVELQWDGAVGSIGRIDRLLPRRSLLTRRESFGIGSQVIAANIDIAFFCMSMNQNYNLRRLERYLAVVLGARVKPVILLTKMDLCENPADYVKPILKMNPELTIITTAAPTGEGLTQLRELITPDSIVTFIGSSGVGKSTIINALMGHEVLKTNAIREEDARGRHTTTHRQLLYLPDGGIVIDTPGMREIGLDESHVDEAFAKVKELVVQCRFADCTHTTEPGCAIQAAIASGTLSKERFLNYQKLHAEEQRRQGFKKRRNRR